MSGNLCRCGAYVAIVEAVARAAEAHTNASDEDAATDGTKEAVI